MALYPLPPSSNESGSKLGVMYGRWLCTSSSFFPAVTKQCRLSLSHVGTLPWRFSVHCEMNKEIILKKIKQFLLWFFFFCTLKSGRRVLICSVQLEQVPVTAYLAPSTWPSIISAIKRLQPHVCTSRLFCLDLFEIAQWLATLLLEISFYLQALQLICRRSHLLFFSFFLFFLLTIAQQNGSKPPHSHMKVLSFAAMYKLFRWPLSPQPKIKKCETTFCRSALLLSFCVSVTINKKVNSTEQGVFSPRWSPLRMRTKRCRFSYFLRSFKQKKIKALRRKMTKIASGGSCLKSYYNLLVGFHRLHRRAYAEAIAVHVKDFEIFRCPHFEKKKVTQK